MIGRIVRIFANEHLRRRRIETGRGPGRLPPTSMHQAQRRAVNHVVRAVLGRFMRR